MKYGTSSNREEASMKYAVWYFWDGLGFLYRNGLIDEDTMYSLNSAGGITYMWKKFGSVIQEIRTRYNMPQLGVDMEYLAEEHRKMLVKRGYDPEPPEELGKYIPDQ